MIPLINAKLEELNARNVRVAGYQPIRESVDLLPVTDWILLPAARMCVSDLQFHDTTLYVQIKEHHHGRNGSSP
jgi:hypothetical protein